MEVTVAQLEADDVIRKAVSIAGGLNTNRSDRPNKQVVETTMAQFTPFMIDTAPAGSCGTLEKTKEVFGFVPDPQPHTAESSELLKRPARTVEAA